jgi:DNA-binding transcriptional LysR family regulator
MELRHLFTFIAVVESGSFTKAAGHLGYAQSSITAQIQSLEAELETPLFDRLGKKIVLTSAGQRFLPYAQEITKLHAQAKDAIRYNAEIAGTIVIGAPESLAAFRLPQIIREYKSLYPQVHIILKPGQCWEMPDRLRTGEQDLAFMLEVGNENEEKDMHKETLVEERMALIAPKGHPLADKGPVDPCLLKDEVILQTEPGCTYQRLFEHSLNNNGVYPSQRLEFWSIEAIKNCVMSGLGLSFLPLITVRSEIEQGELVQLDWDDVPQRLVTQMAYHRKKALSPALQELIRLAREHAAKWQLEYSSSLIS